MLKYSIKYYGTDGPPYISEYESKTARVEALKLCICPWCEINLINYQHWTKLPFSLLGLRCYLAGLKALPCRIYKPSQNMR